MTPEEFHQATGVSRETMARLSAYARLLAQWQSRLNLVGPRTLPDLWERHMLDSAQLFPLLPAGTRSLVDLGSGAGFPGLVLAIMGVEDVHLVEADTRKAVFLREAARTAGVRITVHNCRIEKLALSGMDVVTARALAPLPVLLGYVCQLMKEDGLALFPKGRNHDAELTDARRLWHIKNSCVPSQIDSDGVIIRFQGCPVPRNTAVDVAGSR